ncbi:hypothetical protein JOE57_000311 [Microlunatus panaciterrae]|uniref:ATP-binding protein n=1 Tax=Microlunatus panaciterrae TaxID=400768 RepID=A0ABS2REG1_9ACTN|nr:hypothetical protein [Microlunatus panaciterrae]MBM7797390.1 hypothetical protein [Microlunatus panaciterrae]
MSIPAGSRRYLPDSPFNRRPVEPPKVFEVEDRVTHDRYGLGRVSEIENSGAVIVDFGSGRLRVKAPFTKLYKL